MKQIIVTVALMVVGVSAIAQSYEDAVRFNINEVEGTARSQAMGSAFGALGADLTSIAINPAGAASYRATEVGITLGVDMSNAESNYYNTIREDDKVFVPLNQLGAAFTTGLTNQNTKGIVSSTFAVSYSQLANFTQNAFFRDEYGKNSYLDYFCTDGAKYNEFSGNLAYNAYLTNDYDSVLTYNIWEKVIEEEDGLYLDQGMREDENGDGLVDHAQYLKNRGYKGETTIAYAVNISNMINVGASLGIQSFYLSNKVLHTESYYGSESVLTNSFRYSTEFKQDGAGVNLKIGVIAKPINQLRIGVAFHTPTFYSINEKYSAIIAGGNYTITSPRGEYEYIYRTPGAIVASVAGVLGKYGIVSFDYETSDQSKGKFKEKDDDIWGAGTFDETNETLKQVLKRTHTIRVGLEGRLADQFYLRAGYKQVSSPYKSDYITNSYKNYAISGGLGFRQSNFYVDLAYVYRCQVRDYWVLPDADYPYEPNAPAKLTSTNNNIVITAGLRF